MKPDDFSERPWDRSDPTGSPALPSDDLERGERQAMPSTGSDHTGDALPSADVEHAGRSMVPPAPGVAGDVFGDRLPLAERFVAVLADSGVTHGLLGPREVPRLWERHVLNCAVIQEVVPRDTTVLDVGSGAGLPGIALALARPDLTVHLVEPMLRRTDWLSAIVAELALGNVTVHRARAEDLWGQLSAPVVAARAVARLDALARWCLPLVAGGGSLLALKGASVEEELAQTRTALRALGSVAERIILCGVDLLEPATTVVRLDVGPHGAPGGSGGGGKRPAAGSRHTRGPGAAHRSGGGRGGGARGGRGRRGGGDTRTGTGDDRAS